MVAMSQQFRSSRISWFVAALALGVAPALLVCAADKEAADKGSGATRKVEAKGLTLTVPKAWTKKDSRSRFRLAEFEVTPVEGDHEPAELVVFLFGQREGGDAEANIQRWIGQVEPKERNAVVWLGKASTGKYHLVDVSGNYKKPIGPPIQQQFELKKGWRVLNVRLEAESGLFFLKLAGPEKTVNAAADGFRKSFGADPASEKEVPQEKSGK